MNIIIVFLIEILGDTVGPSGKSIKKKILEKQKFRIVKVGFQVVIADSLNQNRLYLKIFMTFMNIVSSMRQTCHHYIFNHLFGTRVLSYVSLMLVSPKTITK